MDANNIILQSCLQSVKDTKFESNSQHDEIAEDILQSCLQSVKDTKFESNSQPNGRIQKVR